MDARKIWPKVGAAVALGLALGGQALAGCPAGQEVQKALSAMFPRAKGLRVEQVRKAPAPGFCEVILGTKGPFKNVVYVDESGRFAFLGQLVDLKKKRNLTRATVAELSRLTPAQMKRIEELVAFSEGRGGKTVYLVTDPDCPFCKRLEKTLIELVKEGKVTVKVLLMPLDRLHPKAKEKAVAVVCDGKGLEALATGYTSANQCEAGKKRVEETQRFLGELGIRGTPAMILPDGRILRGALPRQEIEKQLGL